MGDQQHDVPSNLLSSIALAAGITANAPSHAARVKASGDDASALDSHAGPATTIARPEPAHHALPFTRDAIQTDVGYAHVKAPVEVDTTQAQDLREGAGFEHDVTELRSYGDRSNPKIIPSGGIDSGELRGGDGRIGHGDDGWKSAIRLFWKRQISISVNHDNCRDHLALERTFLGYVRTSLALSFTGVTIAQLFRLEDTAESDGKSIYFLGRGMASMFIAGSMVIVSLGGWRFWRQQNALVRGKVHAGGYEVYLTMLLTFSIVTMMLAVILGIDRFKPQQGS